MEIKLVRQKIYGAADWQEFSHYELVEMLESAIDCIDALEEKVSLLTPVAADAAIRRCPECRAMLEENSVYCDRCGTDTPRR
jgi:predicted RNA-binding Zn-ribbon protein involved in translation (DUF1610 family)